MIARLIGDRSHLPNAIALNSLLINCARVVGPAIAGILIAAVGEAICFGLNALSFGAVLYALARHAYAGASRRMAGELAGGREVGIRSSSVRTKPAHAAFEVRPCEASDLFRLAHGALHQQRGDRMLAMQGRPSRRAR
jgi:hypothetical protein